MTGKHFSTLALTIFMLAAFVLAQPTTASASAQQTSTPSAQAEPKPQQDKSKRPSPPGTADCTINGKRVTIDYSRPSLKGRKLGTDLAPYGKVWRTGANEATTLTTAIALDIGGAKVPAGTYTLYTLPSEGTWKLIINKQKGQWGTEYHQEQDLARVDMKKQEIVVPVEQFTISLDQDSNDSADLILEWEKTRVFVVIRAQ
ncbi:MAG TPA: DUF2911 domain-containing protein [Candidatus Angelobacter sp.]|nr:DUF2911 domain-containing protein [Candidatus Angelobacter sp.]